MPQPILLVDHLREATRFEHRSVELLPFAAALADGKLPLDSYIGFLDALLVVHSSLEQAVASATHPVVLGVWEDALGQLPRLQADLAFFRPRQVMKSPAVSIRAHLLAQRIRQRAEDEPVSLLGYLYVFVGATLGGKVLKAQVARTFGLDGSDGLAYLSNHDDGASSPWGRFRKRMNAASVDEHVQSRIIEAAKEAFASTSQIIQVLYPFEVDQSQTLAQALNSEAGRHAVPQDEREIHAALRAGERTWSQYPYYKWRYGSRGERFTRSDSAWLVTLVSHEPVVFEKQITWLGRLLSARGMPQWLLENHLGVLHDELVKALPENAMVYLPLRRAADALGTMRRTHVADEVMALCASTFARNVGEEWSQRLPEAGSLLAAAVADEKLNIAMAVPSLETWMIDRSRFPERWINAVHMTIRMARKSAK